MSSYKSNASGIKISPLILNEEKKITSRKRKQHKERVVKNKSFNLMPHRQYLAIPNLLPLMRGVEVKQLEISLMFVVGTRWMQKW
jgi:hypothetical protein